MNRAKNLEVILTLCVALVVFFFVFQEKSLLFVAIALGIIGMFSDYLSRKISWVWLTFAKGISFIMSHVILTIVFFLFLLPLSLLAKLFKKNAIRLKQHGQTTCYITRNHEFKAQDLETMW